MKKLTRKVVCKVCKEKFELYHDLKHHFIAEHPEHWGLIKAFVEETPKVKVVE